MSMNWPYVWVGNQLIDGLDAMQSVVLCIRNFIPIRLRL